VRVRRRPQTGDTELAEWRRIAWEGSSAGECAGADLRALITRLDAAEQACHRYRHEGVQVAQHMHAHHDCRWPYEDCPTGPEGKTRRG
jgi:hypothetical protein